MLHGIERSEQNLRLAFLLSSSSGWHMCICKTPGVEFF